VHTECLCKRYGVCDGIAIGKRLCGGVGYGDRFGLPIRGAHGLRGAHVFGLGDGHGNQLLAVKRKRHWGTHRLGAAHGLCGALVFCRGHGDWQLVVGFERHRGAH
jgi:hypothetical protein